MSFQEVMVIVLVQNKMGLGTKTFMLLVKFYTHQISAEQAN